MFFVIALCRGLPERIGINEVMNMIAKFWGRHLGLGVNDLLKMQINDLKFVYFPRLWLCYGG